MNEKKKEKKKKRFLRPEVSIPSAFPWKEDDLDFAWLLNHHPVFYEIFLSQLSSGRDRGDLSSL